MNKNLKKVISSVVALALSLGSLSAFAASYTDVADTATYATAVNELSALGIVNGYEDGTFQPDKKVTRAEVTKMVVAALAQTAAADAAKGATAFSDVAADHWASGFINVGSNASGFINGMGDGTFAPEANVTYAQLVKMLVTSLGYGGMALQEGGYPTGYITVGDRIGVTKSVVANANDELTREQVARLIDNSINLPLLVTTVWSAANPEYEIKDGKGKGFQTLLTEYHDTYKVEGKIIQTSKSDSTLESNEARFEIAVADRFDDDDYFTRTDETRDREEVVIVSDGIDVDSALFAYSTALIYKNEDDEFELISLSSTAKSKTVELSAGAFDDENKDYDGDPAAALEDYAKLNYYATDAKTGKVTEYKLADGDNTDNEAELWVNGVSMDGWDKDDIEAYIVNNKVGTVTLVDAPQGSKATTDGYYDYVLVTYYKSAIVSDVMSDGVVYFDVAESAFATEIEFDEDKVEDGDLQYTITLDGKEIEYTDLQEDDVISIAWDVTGDFEDSSFYEVIVVRGTVEGKVTSEDTDDETFTVSGTTYKYDEFNLSDGYNDEAVGTDVELFVDAFGRIVKMDEASSSKKFAILDNVWHSDGEDVYYAKIVTPDGSPKDYEIKEDDDVNDMYDIAYKSGDVENKGAKRDIQDRVVTYKVNSSNLIYAVTTSGTDKKDSGTDAEYAAKSNKIGSVKLNDNTQILDASEYTNKISDLKTVSSLVDETKYTAYGYDKLSDGTYSFVIITDGIGGYTDDTQVAVFVKSFKDINDEGDSADAITVLYNGEETSFILDNVNDVDDFNKGDVIVFKKNSSNEIDEIKLIAAMGLCKGTSRADYKTAGYNVVPNVIDKWNKDKNDDTEVELDFGVIVDKSSSEITLTTYGAENSTTVEREYDLTDDTKVYVYNYKEVAKSALFVGTKSNIIKTAVQSSAKDDDDNIDWDAINEYGVNYAFVKAVDGDATEVVVVIGPGKENY